MEYRYNADRTSRGWTNEYGVFMSERLCAGCEAWFSPARDNQVHCSPACRAHARNARVRESRRVETIPEKTALRRSQAKERMRRKRQLTINRHDREAIKLRLYAQQNGKCPWCGEHLDYDGAHLDHYLPLALGGEDTPDNLKALLHPGCNSRKATINPESMPPLAERRLAMGLPTQRHTNNVP